MPSEYDKPRSICRCGHTGDGPGSQHGKILEKDDGGGKCNVKGCDCDRFTWKNFTKDFAKYIKGGQDG